MKIRYFKLGLVFCMAAMVVAMFSSCEKSETELQKKYSIVNKANEGNYLKVTSVVPLPEFWPFDIKSDSLEFHMSSLESRDVIFSYWMKYEKKDDMLAFTMYIPHNNLPHNGEYRVAAIVEPDGTRHYRRFSFEFSDYVLVAATNSTYNYTLPVADDTQTKGVEANPYLIKTVTDMVKFSNELKKDPERGYGLHFKLANDIDFNDYYKDPNRPMDQGWCGIGDDFSGNFNASNYTISNFKYNSSSGDNIGLFKKLSDGATVRNLKMTYVDISNAHNMVAAVAGSSSGTVLIDYVDVSGNIRAGGYQVAGMVGLSSGSLTISNSSVSGNISCGDDLCGGFVGYAIGESVQILNSRVNALYVESDVELVGGFIGMSAVQNCTIKDCYSSPTINGSRVVGGLIGQISGGTSSITNTQVDANVINASNSPGSGSVNEYCGGIVGLNAGVLNVTKCEVFHSTDAQYDEDIIGSEGVSMVGGIAGASHVELHIDESVVKSPVHGKDRVGGMVGLAEGVIEITNSENSNKSKVTGNSKVGGLIGEISSYNAYLNVADQYASVTAAGNYCGSIVGYTGRVTIDDVYVAGSVASAGDFVGGIAGFADGIKVTNLNMVSTLKVNGASFVGGVAGYLEDASFDSDFLTKNVKFSIEITNSGHTAGGFAGRAVNSTFKNLTLHCTVVGKDTVGGFVGSNGSGGHYENCTFAGAKVNGTGDFTGGIIGRVNHKGTTLTNLTNKGSVIGENRTGGILGELANNNVYNCYNEGTVSGAQDVGGIIGRITNTGNDSEIEIKGCENNGTVESTKRCLGGICGYVSSNKNGKQIVSFRLCFNDNLVNGIGTNNQERDGMGGIVGEGKYSIRLANCGNRGTVRGTTAYHHIGGIAGYLGENSKGYDNDLYVDQCYNSGLVEVTGQNNSVYVGGIAGHLEDAATTDRYVYVYDCYNIGTVKANTSSGDNAGGMVGKASFYLTMIDCYSAGMVYSKHGSELSNGMAGTHADAEELYGTHKSLYTQKNTGKDWWGSYFDAADRSKKSTYDGFDFEGNEGINHPIWRIDTSKNNGYPYLINTPL